MAGQVKSTPTFALTPSSERTPTAQNYITNFDFLNQYLPDTYEKEFERYGNRTISSFLRMVGAEMPTNSDLIKWAEQGRLHTKYTSVGSGGAQGADQVTFQVNDVLDPAAAEQVIRVGQQEQVMLMLQCLFTDQNLKKGQQECKDLLNQMISSLTISQSS